MSQRKEVTYSNYLHINELIKLTENDINHHEEHLFITVHQNFELWFRQILFDLTSVRDLLEKNKFQISPQEAILVTRRLARTEKILKNSMDSFDVIETMLPVEFLEFRDYIGTASGFQSAQNREIEVLFGIDDSKRVEYYGQHYSKSLQSDKEGLARVERRVHEMTLKTAFYTWLEEIYERVPDSFLVEYEKSIKKDIEENGKIWSRETDKVAENLEKRLVPWREFLKKDQFYKVRIAALFITSYLHEYPEYESVLSALLNLESTQSLWKSKHARMVETMIGRKPGTGGSSGVDYLDQTAKYRVFGELWSVRSQNIRPSALTPMKLL